jgi:hypothetical protein
MSTSEVAPEGDVITRCLLLYGVIQEATRLENKEDMSQYSLPGKSVSCPICLNNSDIKAVPNLLISWSDLPLGSKPEPPLLPLIANPVKAFSKPRNLRIERLTVEWSRKPPLYGPKAYCTIHEINNCDMTGEKKEIEKKTHLNTETPRGCPFPPHASLTSNQFISADRPLIEIGDTYNLKRHGVQNQNFGNFFNNAYSTLKNLKTRFLIDSHSYKHIRKWVEVVLSVTFQGVQSSCHTVNHNHNWSTTTQA